MKRRTYQSGYGYQIQDVLTALNDNQCRMIIEAVTRGPKTANELAQELEIPLSSLYRKLNALEKSSLVKTTIDIRANGKHPMRYSVGFDSVTIDLDDQELDIAVTVDRPPLIAQ